MTRNEFGKVVGFLSAGCGKSITPQTWEVYYSLLREFPSEAIQAAAASALQHSTYAVFPQIGTIRIYALEALHRARIAAETEREAQYPMALPAPLMGVLASRLKDTFEQIGRMPEETPPAVKPVAPPAQPPETP